MARPEQYHQPALSLDQTQRPQGSGEHQSPLIPAETLHDGDEPVMPSIAADPVGLHRGNASDRLPHDFWSEFHREWEFREQHGMTPVSPAEFADMRDFSDGVTLSLDIDQPQPPYERKKTP